MGPAGSVPAANGNGIHAISAYWLPRTITSATAAAKANGHATYRVRYGSSADRIHGRRRHPPTAYWLHERCGWWRSRRASTPRHDVASSASALPWTSANWNVAHGYDANRQTTYASDAPTADWLPFATAVGLHGSAADRIYGSSAYGHAHGSSNAAHERTIFA